MKKLLVSLAAIGGFAAFSAASITPFSVYGGYFRSNSFLDDSGHSVHLSGFELGLQQSLVSLPLLGTVDLGASILLGNSLHDSGSVNGNLFRIYAQYKTPTAGPASIYGIGALAFYSATGSGFSTKSGLGTEIGIGIPLKTPVPGVPSPTIEARYRFGNRAATTGFSVGVSVSF